MTKSEFDKSLKEACQFFTDLAIRTIINDIQNIKTIYIKPEKYGVYSIRTSKK